MEARLIRGPRAALGKSMLVKPQLKPEGLDPENNSRIKELNWKLLLKIISKSDKKLFKSGNRLRR
jgi:hypothetical protein